MTAASERVQVQVSGWFGGVALVTTAVLFVLQVTGSINISWWLVFAPLLVCAGIGVLLAIFAALMIVVALVIFDVEKRANKKARR